MAVYRFFQDGGRPHIGFIGHEFGPPTKNTWSSLSLCRSWLESAL